MFREVLHSFAGVRGGWRAQKLLEVLLPRLEAYMPMQKPDPTRNRWLFTSSFKHAYRLIAQKVELSTLTDTGELGMSSIRRTEKPCRTRRSALGRLRY